MAIGAIWQEMYRSQYFEGGRVLQAAISAIDIALHDIKGKALGVPVYQLLGGKQRDRIPTFASTSAAPGPAMLEQARELVARGWNAIRFFPQADTDGIMEPRESIAATAPWIVKAREALGGAIVLGIDYHHRLSVAEAASFCQKLPAGTLDFLEEPIRDETPEAYESLRTLTDIPFAIGEEFASKWQFLPYIERGIHQFNRIDVCNVGGLTEAMKVAGWSEAHYVDMMPHNPLGPICTAATVHFSAAVANFCLARNARLARRKLHGCLRHLDLFAATAARRRELCGERRARPRHRGRRAGGRRAKLQVLGSAALEAPRWFGHQLVAPVTRRDSHRRPAAPRR